ncbi:hypothetical protein HPB51_006605 [Rhipicephalus microplus]|uniref:Calcineurin-like phosphoesterase domain-containing protein n=1 Tax=Rhipicephalus microplus TaxID=6941 RepID=A0A9J6E7R0_RHIMP|nr:hypothetical protein HPB51_006605 [Rhipicephalus microplus]
MSTGPRPQAPELLRRTMACTRRLLAVLLLFVLVFLYVATIGDEPPRQEQMWPVDDPTGDSVVPNDEHRHLMYFVQVSDTHLSGSVPQRAVHLKEFIAETIMKIIKPPIVVMTGDIVDSLGARFLDSGQMREEWQQYWRAIYETGVTRKHIWLDIRGNHDNLNLASVEDEHNFYRVYSVQGRQHLHSYSYTHRDGDDRYTFIGIDTCTDPGVKRPFNFIGSLPQVRGAIMSCCLLMGFLIAQECNHRQQLGGPYLCGHYHSLLGFFRGMYALQPSGFLELELADWKSGRLFRVAAVDHGLFSFVDVHFREWPIILVTNPKSAVMAMPGVEPLRRITHSTHVRALVFSPTSVSEVRCSVDDGPWQPLKRVAQGPLWVAPWDTKELSPGLHTLIVQAMTHEGLWSDAHVVTFSVDGTLPPHSVAMRILLQGGIRALRILFILIILACVLPLCWIKAVQTSSWLGPPDLSPGRCLGCGCLTRCLHLLVSVDVLFWPLVALPLYLAIGPWFVGEMVEGHLGACFVWGIVVYGTFLPGGLSYFYGMVFIAMCYVPLVCCLGCTLWRRRQALRAGTANPAVSALPLAAVLALQCLWAALFVLAYGYLALIFGFLLVGAPVVSVVSWQRARTLPYHRLEKFERFVGGGAANDGTATSKAGSS